MLLARNLFEPVAMLPKPSEIVARSWRRPFNVLNGRIFHQDSDKRRAIQHREVHASDGLVSRLGN
jgi:hypothetical protein